MRIYGSGGVSEGTMSISSQGAKLWTYTNTNNIENIWSPQNVLTFSISGKSVVLDATVEVYHPNRITTESVLQAFLEHGRGSKTLTLASDIQLTRRAEIRNIFTDEANNVTIDLNGHTISRNFSAAYDDGNVFYVESGNLTINDNSGNGSGKITGGWAIIGPTMTDNAYTAATICAQHETTLILPQCTSAELQRLFAESPYVFHLTQSDIGQIEVMLSCALARKAKSVSLLVNHDDVRSEASAYCYGSTFRNWLGFLAYKAGLKVDTVCTYTNEATLYKAVDNLVELYASSAHDSIESVLLFVPETPEELILYDEYSATLTSQTGKGRNYPFTLCSDASVGHELPHASFARSYEGIDIAPAVTSGFIPAYHTLFGSDNDPIGGEAQLFDALYMLTYALTINPDDVNGSIVKLVDAEDLVYFSWLPTDARLFFSLLQKGAVVSPAGALGDWTFDKRYHASLLNTTYRHWKLSDNQYTTIQYITLNDARRSVSNEQLWLLNTDVEDSFDRHHGPQYEHLALQRILTRLLRSSEAAARHHHAQPLLSRGPANGRLACHHVQLSALRQHVYQLLQRVSASCQTVVSDIQCIHFLSRCHCAALWQVEKIVGRQCSTCRRRHGRWP